MECGDQSSNVCLGNWERERVRQGGGGGGVIEGSPCHMSILRNSNVALSNLRYGHVTLSNLRNCPVPCHYLLKPMSLSPNKPMSQCRFLGSRAIRGVTLQGPGGGEGRDGVVEG